MNMSGGVQKNNTSGVRAPSKTVSNADDVCCTYVVSFVFLLSFILLIQFSAIEDRERIERNTPPEFRVESLSVSNFNLSGSQMTAKWNVVFVLPSKKSSFLDQNLNFSIFYQNQLLLQQGVVPPRLFHVPRSFRMTESFSVFKVKAVALDEIIDGLMAYVMEMGWARGVLAFNLKLEAVGDQGFRFFCENIKVGFSHNYSITGAILLAEHEHPTPSKPLLCTAAPAPNYYLV
ncbi:hypothetical protein COLO4_22670 [Corchorus olitorius]|uniref:Uncharacterized protein n=1 Tax=Corchorus olitorius TaxID=93759 RepID=A0A1R3IKU4_9ROSI|nr:hypothetical protein COLO4_22670 [Corchorus olitorius]